MFDVFMKVVGAKAGEMKGISENTKYKDWIDVLSYSHELVAPVDVHTGTASGKVQFRPIKVKKKIDPATPLLYKALTDNENLKEVFFEFWTSGATGGLQKYMDIKLTNGRVVSSEMTLAPSGENTATTTRATASVGLVTQTVELTYETMTWTVQGFDKKGATLGGPRTAEIKWGEM